ncbi:hypothetical protein JCM3770_001617 [Rhodotorula araucariae]
MRLYGRTVPVLALCALLPLVVSAQDTAAPTLPSRPASSFSASRSTASTLSASNATAPASSTSVASSVTGSAVPASTPAPSPSPPEAATSRPALATHVEPWSGVLGGLLLVTGLFLGSAASQFPRAASGIDGLYAGALVVGLVVLKFTVVPKLNPPSHTARGLYLLAAVGGGFVVAVPCALVPRATAPLAGALAGLAASVFLLATRDDALIRPLGLRYILVVGLVALGFVLASIPRIQPPVLLVCTSAVGAFVVVLGIDCFTSAGLKELYVYVLGFDELFTKLEGHFRLTTGIIAELAATAALFFIFMAIQSRFLSLFIRRDADVKSSQREHAAQDDELGRAHQRRSRVELSDWEEKYGAGGGGGGGASSGESDDRTLLASPGMDKARSRGSVSSFLSAVGAPHAAQSRSVDFLPKLELAEYAAGRPALATIQPRQADAAKPEWESYVASRKVAIAPPRPAVTVPPKRASRALSLFSFSRRETRMPVDAFTGHEDEDDNVPLAEVRSLSSGAVPRAQPATMQDIGAPPSSALAQRSRSRMSLALPAVLAPPSPPLDALAAQPQRPATLARVGRRHTLLDLSSPSTFDPYHDRARQAKKGAEPERIAVGDRRRAQSAEALVTGAANSKGKSKEVGGGARIMDFGELEEKHRKRLSMLQGTANDKVSSAAARAHYQAQQRAEAEAQRRRESVRHSVDAGLHRLPPSPAETLESDKPTRKRASASMGSLALGTLLRRPGSRTPPAVDANEAAAEEEEKEDTVPLSALTRDYAPPRERERARRASTLALVAAPSPSASAPHLASIAARPSLSPSPGPAYRPSAVRRHSLGTLLEAVAHDAAPAAASRRPRVDERVDKVAAWRHSGGGSPPIPGAGPGSRRATPGEAALLQRTAEAAPASATKKKHDWLSY